MANADLNFPIDVTDVIPKFQSSLIKLDLPLLYGMAVSLAWGQRGKKEYIAPLTSPAVGIKGTVDHVSHRKSKWPAFCGGPSQCPTCPLASSFRNIETGRNPSHQFLKSKYTERKKVTIPPPLTIFSKIFIVIFVHRKSCIKM